MARLADKSRGFTLVELLVVVAIIGVLIGILMPSLSKARAQSRKAGCGQVLHGLAVGIQAYLSQYNHYYPIAAQMPSVNTDKPALGAALKGEIPVARAWKCPADINGYLRNGTPFDSYYAGEGLSYEYNMFLGGKHIEQDFLYRLVGTSGVFVLADFDCFHDRQGSAQSKNILFGDGHIGPITDIAASLGGTTLPVSH